MDGMELIYCRDRKLSKRRSPADKRTWYGMIENSMRQMIRAVGSSALCKDVVVHDSAASARRTIRPPGHQAQCNERNA